MSSLEDGVVKNTLLDAGAAYGSHHATADIKGGDAKENAKILLSVLRGEEQGAYRAAAVENAAAAILVGGKSPDYKTAIALACESIDSGRAMEKLSKLIETAKA